MHSDMHPDEQTRLLYATLTTRSAMDISSRVFAYSVFWTMVKISSVEIGIPSVDVYTNCLGKNVFCRIKKLKRKEENKESSGAQVMSQSSPTRPDI